MARINIVFLFLFFFFSFQIFAQDHPCPDAIYRNYIDQGNKLKKTDFKQALANYNAARDWCPGLSKEVDELIVKMFQEIEGQRNEANRLAEVARRRAEEADKAKAEAQKSRKEAEDKARLADSLRREAEAALNKFKDASCQIVLFLMTDADKFIKALNYEGALEKVKAAIPLQQETKAVEKRLLEIAYVFNETGRYERAKGLLDTLYSQIRKTSQPLKGASSLEDLRQALRVVSPLWYDTLHTMRYYPEMVWVEGGTFTMGRDMNRGDGDFDDDEFHPHSVTLSDFRIARTETTVWQFYIYCENDSINIRDFAPGWGLSGDNPIVNVSWDQATQYAVWLSNRPTTGSAFRLPTEAQWEYAARGGKMDTLPLFIRSDNLDKVGWDRENSEIDEVWQTHQVGAKKANELGLYDMSGNVWEWSQDWSGAYEENAVPDPKGPPVGKYRVTRGGFWYFLNWYTRVSNRHCDDPNDGDYYIYVFRVSQE